MNRMTGAWSQLDGAAPAVGELATRLISPERTGVVFIGVDSEGSKHLLVQLLPDDKGFEDRQSRGMLAQTVLRSFVNEGEKRFIDIECADRTAEPMLDLLAEEILNAFDDARLDAAQAVKAAFTKWRRIWAQLPKSLLNPDQQAGLFSELWFLINWLYPIAGLRAFARWRGPDGARHDFEWIGTSVEVKSTRQVVGRIHTINGIDQLDRPTNGTLYLFSQRLREEGGAMANLPILVNQVRDILKIDGELRDFFDVKLLSAGYHDAHAEEYEKHKWRVVDEFLFVIPDEFPRLTASLFKNGLPASVQAVRYDLNLQGQESYIVASRPEEAAKILQ